jgi:hypothetical protein
VSRGNPAWTREEIVLALDLYFELAKPVKRRDPRILQLSADFKRMAAARGVDGGPNLRNPTSVYFKMNNFLELDSAYKGTGFHNYSELDQKIWNEFERARPALRQEAARIRTEHLDGAAPQPMLTQEVIDAWDEVVRRNRERVPADKSGRFSIAALRERLRPIREGLRDELSRQLPGHPALAGLKAYCAGFWQAGPKGARLTGYIWNFLASDNAKTRARLQTTFTVDKDIRAEYVAYPASDSDLAYDITKISAALRDDRTFASFRSALSNLPRGFFLFCETGDGEEIDEYVDELSEETLGKLHSEGISRNQYFTIAVDRPRGRLSNLGADQLASLLLADLSDLAAIRAVFDGKHKSAAASRPPMAGKVDRSRRASAPPSKSTYRPEFSGTKTYSPPKTPVEADCRHGDVVDALSLALGGRKIRHGNDRFRDLYILGDSDALKVLFEVKTDLGTSSIYSAIGQLMLHGAAEAITPTLVAVLPGSPDSRTAQALEKLGIKILSYDLANKISFHYLDKLLDGQT